MKHVKKFKLHQGRRKKRTGRAKGKYEKKHKPRDYPEFQRGDVKQVMPINL